MEIKLQAQSTAQSRQQLAAERARTDGRRQEIVEKLIELREALTGLDGGDQEAAATRVGGLETEEQERRAHIHRLEKEFEEFNAELESAAKAQTKESVRLAELKGSRQNLGTKRDNLSRLQRSTRDLQEEARAERSRLQREQDEFARIVQKNYG